MSEHEFVVQQNELGNIRSSLEYVLKSGIPKDARILDVGCNFGTLIQNLSLQGYGNVFGVDVNGEAVRKGKETYPQIADRLQRQEYDVLAFPDESFDVVLMFDVIEHVPRIREFLRNHVCRVLKKGGTFIFQTPNKYTNIPWEIVQQRSLTKWKMYHCSLQTVGSLRALLEDAGFDRILVEKNDILTEHNKRKLTKTLGFLGIPALHVLQRMPLSVYPNFWGSAVRMR